MCVCLGVGLVFSVFSCWLSDHFISVLLAFVVLGLVSSVPSQEIGSMGERLRNDLFCVDCDVKPIKSTSAVCQNYVQLYTQLDSAMSTFMCYACFLLVLRPCNALGRRYVCIYLCVCSDNNFQTK